MESYITLAEAAKLLPCTSNGKHPSTVTLWRWCTVGINGVRLEHVRLGKRILVSAEALERFGIELAEALARPATPAPRKTRGRTPAQREKDLAAARAIVEA